MRKTKHFLKPALFLVSAVLLGIVFGFAETHFLSNKENPYPVRYDASLYGSLPKYVASLPKDAPLFSVLSGESVPQGGAFLFRAEKVSFPRDADFGGIRLNFFQVKERGPYFVLLGVSAKYTPDKDVEFRVFSDEDEEIFKTSVFVRKSDFPMTVLKTTPELEKAGYTPALIQSYVAEENKILGGAIVASVKPMFSGPFVYPLRKMEIVGAYGNIRKSGNVSLQHLGLDLDADEGTPVRAINDGIVMLVYSFKDYGNTVVIDHGGTVSSAYLHLKEARVKKGDEVLKGGVIGYSGNTGYSLAPHLHLSVYVRGVSINPLNFFDIANKMWDE